MPIGQLLIQPFEKIIFGGIDLQNNFYIKNKKYEEIFKGGICVEKKRFNINQEGKIKLFLTFSLLAYSIYITILTKNFDVLSCMIFSTLGDICIMSSRGAVTGKNEKTFGLGVILFSIAHMEYILVMQSTRYIPIIAMVSVCLVIIISTMQKEGAKLNYIPYTVILFCNAINAWFYAPLAGIGMLFFLASDLILSICENRSPKWQIAIWATYVPAQILLLTAILIS